MTNAFHVVNDRPYYWVVRTRDGHKVKVYMSKTAAQDFVAHCNRTAQQPPQWDD